VKGCCLRLVLAWLVSVGVGCTSAPVRYYTLTAPPDEASPGLKSSLAIDVRVHTPPQLKRSELIVRTGPTEMALLDNERWSSPVNDEIKDALRLKLRRRLDSTPGLPPDFTRLTLDVDVQHLEAALGEYALLEASWSATLSAADPAFTGARATTCAFRATEKIHAGYTGIVDGYQRDIDALAQAIAAALRSLVSGVDAACAKSIVDH
jgi:uncharacterized protein